MGCDGIAKLVFFKAVAHIFGNGEVIAQAKRETVERRFFGVMLSISKTFDDVLVRNRLNCSRVISPRR